jgi:hypothetical protein
LTLGFEYCIYTEDNGSSADIVAKYFDNFTIVPSMSFWKGQTTTNACITILSEEPCPERVEHLIEEIMVRNKSEIVLLTILRLHDIELVTRSITKAEMLGGYLIGLARTNCKEDNVARDPGKPERSEDTVSALGLESFPTGLAGHWGLSTGRGKTGDALTD